MELDDDPTTPLSDPLPRTLLEDAVWSPLAYTGILHALLDGGMSALSPPAQILYLQLVREAIGRRRHVVRISLEELRTKTGLSRSTLHAALKQLASPALDVVNIVPFGGVPKSPAVMKCGSRVCSSASQPRAATVVVYPLPQAPLSIG